MWLNVFRWCAVLLMLGSFGYYLLAIYAARRFFRRRSSSPADFTPPVSVLKPVRGLDREAYENYASFCKQDYPEFEILFCVLGEDDPALPVLRRIIEDFPQRHIRLLIGAEQLGTCNKVNKLVRLAREARYDLLIVSDSDVRVSPGYLRGVVAPFGDPQVGGVTCLYRGLTDGSLGSELEAVGNTSDFAAGVICARLTTGVNFALGATMATTKKHLSEIGGFETLANHFADDYELGHRIAAHGHRVELLADPVCVVYPRQSLGESFAHQVRWTLAMRLADPPKGLGLIFTHGLPWAVLAAALAPRWELGLLCLLMYLLLRPAMAWTVGVWGLRDPLLRRKMWMVPLRDAFTFIAWLASFFKRRIKWRGSEFYVRDKLLVPAGPRPARG
jgi:ceramide glucosyltransferase